MIHEIKVTVAVVKGNKTVEQTIVGRTNARNGKGAVRVFLASSEALAELGNDIRGIEVTPLPDESPRGFLGEEVEKKTKKSEPAAEG